MDDPDETDEIGLGNLAASGIVSFLEPDELDDLERRAREDGSLSAGARDRLIASIESRRSRLQGERVVVVVTRATLKEVLREFLQEQGILDLLKVVHGAMERYSESVKNAESKHDEFRDRT